MSDVVVVMDFLFSRLDGGEWTVGDNGVDGASDLWSQQASINVGF